MLKVKVINKSKNLLPEYKTPGSSGVDEGYEAQIRPRSGLAANHGITVLNTPGTIDADYRGEIRVILHNTSMIPYTVEEGERIAQMVFNKVERVSFEEVDSLDNTERGDGGFGHSGKM